MRRLCGPESRTSRTRAAQRRRRFAERENFWRTHKCLLPTYDVFDEDRYFEPAKTLAPFEFNGHRLGITICEDIWNDEDFWPERLYRRDPIKELIAQGAEIILNLSASPWHDGKECTRLAMLRRVARDEHVPLAQVNWWARTMN